MWLNFAGEMYMEMNGVKEICVLGFLGINSWIDIRKKQVSLLLIIIFAVCGTVWAIYSRRNVPEVLMCVGTGFLFVLISILTEGAVGMGDGWLLMALGTVLYPEEFFNTFYRNDLQCSMVRHHDDGILQKGKYGNTVCAISAGRISGRIFDMKDNFCITNEYSIIRKGSFTIETACVMPLILLVLMGLIYLSFFVHNRAWLTAAAYESAVSGSMEGIKKNGEIYDIARMRSEELGSIGFFGAENLGTQTNVGKEVQVTYDLDTISSYGNLSWHLRTEGKSAVINPVKHIRRLRAAQAVLREMGE